jgi:hypothetical protein
MLAVIGVFILMGNTNEPADPVDNGVNSGGGHSEQEFRGAYPDEVYARILRVPPR